MFLLIREQDPYKEGPCSWPLYAQQAHDKLINYSFSVWYSIKVHSSSQFPVFWRIQFLLLFSHEVVSESLRLHGLQPARLPCPSLSPKFTQIRVHWVDDTIQPSHSLSPLLLLPSVFPSLRIFSIELALCIRWAKYSSFSFSISISPSNEYSGLVSFRID